MRLICPNCQAQYEVADNAIPAGGRDVQCSNCGNTWYQMPLGANGAAPAARTMAAPPPPAPKAEPAAPVAEAKPAVAKTVAAAASVAATVAETPVEKPKPVRKTKAPEAPVAEAPAPAPVASAEPAPAAAPAPASEPEPEPVPEALPQRKIDSNVLAVLREEAEREAARRAADAKAEADAAAAATAPTEPTKPEATPAVAAKPGKPDLTVIENPTPETAAETTSADDADKASPSSAVAKLQAAIATKPVEADAKPKANVAATDAAIAAVLAASLGDDSLSANRQGKGRELLPDIEEIKSSLRSAVDEGAEETDDASQDPVAAQQQRHGFRRGFISAMVIGLLLSASYVSAPRIVAAVPALAGPMESYVSSVNAARFYLDSLLRRASSSIEGEG